MTVSLHAPSVSVVVPSYNYGHFIAQRLRSILDQTYQDFEVIVIDDGSTDSSAEVIAKFESDPRVRAIYCEQNSGSVYQRWNEGAALARGRYLWFAGADDYCEENLLEELVGPMDTETSVGIAFTQSWMVDGQGKRRFRAPVWNRTGTRRGAQARQLLLLDTTIANASGVLLRTDIFRDVGGFDLSFRLAADWKLYLDVLSKSDLFYVSEPLNYCRMHSSTVSIQARRSGSEAVERYRLVSEVCNQCSDLHELKSLAFDREAQRCLINAANSFRKGSIRPALRILSAGSKWDDRHAQRMLKHIPSLATAIKTKLLGTLRDTPL